MHMQSTHEATHTVTHMHTYNNQPAGECVLDPHPLHLHTATRGFLARFKLQPASNNHLR